MRQRSRRQLQHRARRRPVVVGNKLSLQGVLVNRSDIEGLRRAWRERQLVLCLGAGVSMDYGLPSWSNLVLELLFEQAQGTRRLRTLLPHYRRAVAAWMTDYFEYDPMVLARMLERDLGRRRRARPSSRSASGSTAGIDAEARFLEHLRRHLYTNERTPAQPTTLGAVADLIAKSGQSGGIAAVVTFNFDDLLERELERRGQAFLSITDGSRRRGNGLCIYHAHGFVPSAGPLVRQNVVFTEKDYHRLTESVFHWSLSEVVERLRKNTLLFVGLSMSDPNLRRLLDAAKNSDIPAHWQIQKHHAIRDHERGEVRQNVENRARHYAQVLGHPWYEGKTPEELNEALDSVLRQADTYDREVFESMGVKTIWVDDFAHIPPLLAAIPGRAPRPA